MDVKKTKTLYLRGMSESVVREAKVLAARRATTLTALVDQALTRFIDSEPQDTGRLPQSLRSEQDWYEANKEKLVKRYEGEYVAVVGQKVLDHDRDFGALAGRVFSRLGGRPVFLPKCLRGVRSIAVTSPRREVSR